jgi:monoterpene epsilon-lactone hydrolase
MPTIASKLVHGLLADELAKRDPDRDVVEARRLLDEGGRLLRPPASVTLADGTEGGVPGEWLHPEPADATARILYLHGGAYVVGSRVSHRGLAGKVAVEVGADTFLAEYRLAPEHPFPAALDDAIAAFDAIAGEVGPDRVLVAGDSAGGGLAVALGVALRDRGAGVPGAIAAFSPWVDLTASGASIHELNEVDVMLDGSRVGEIAAVYCDQTPVDDPLVSPLFADLTGFPPLLVHAGTAEILRDDAVRLVERAREAGVDASLRLYEGMWHVWPAFWRWVPEGRQAIREVARFWWRVAGGPPAQRPTL